MIFSCQCEKFEGNRACCGGCPKECRDAFQQKRTLEKCRKYGMDKAEYGDQCFYEVINDHLTIGCHNKVDIICFLTKIRSVQRSAWMPLNLVTVCLSVKDMKAILDVAQGKYFPLFEFYFKVL